MKKCEEYMQYSVLCQGCSYPNDINCCKKVNDKERDLEKQDQELKSLTEQYNKLLEQRCFTAFDLLAEELKELDYCSGLILAGSNGDFEFKAIKNDKKLDLEERLILIRMLNKHSNFRGVGIQIYDEDDIEDIKKYEIVIREIEFER